MAITESGDRLLLECAVIPKSREEKIIGLVAGALKVKLTAPPSDGKANKQLLKLLAREFGLKVSDLNIEKGMTSRRKIVSLARTAALPAYLADTLG